MPENFKYEQMAHEYAETYRLDPEWVKDNKTQFNYYEMLLMLAQKSAARDYIIEQKSKKNNGNFN